MSKSVLVTGASSGIGRATALRLAARGHTVFAAARRLERLESLAAEATGTVIPVQLDVRDADSIAQAVRTVEQTHPQGIDVLVNNAGYSLLGPVETLSADEIRDQFDTNVLGLVEVTRAFLPAMRARRSGTVVNVSSVLGRMTVVGTGVYGGTKYAVEALSDALRLELAHLGIDVVLVEPGFTDTDLDTGRSEGSSTIPDYAEVETMAAEYVEREMKKAISPERVADVMVRVVEARSPGTRYLVPRRFAGLIALLNALPDKASDRAKLRSMR
ncbi:hypothetical protein ASD11_01880 [Aeromicrobium sp. Root495]|uniref:SDR family oxidoreductase n=1 Tax=Aeromicrobium sp. Root495 TaxID=1736550 RepID=UPI0006F2BF78|nr:SDR family oxidoreductase [Aeromicrobium sp. Root495]KQY58439.1 hypothetical protein ASD11_01880 [Aeromicrobium sp. Root495]